MADPVVKNINMAGWFKVKLIELRDTAYTAGGLENIVSKPKAVLAVNGEGGMTGYVTDDKKIMLYAGGTEASGTVTADVYVLLE